MEKKIAFSERVAKQSAPLYEALLPIDHTAHGRVYGPGERFDLQHLAPEMIQRLIDWGCVKRCEE